MLSKINNMNWDKLGWAIAIDVAIVVVIATFLLPGGQDLYNHYYPLAWGCLNCALVPYFTQWLVWPLASIPPQLAWPLVSVLSVFSVLAVCRMTKVNPALVFLSFPFLAEIWLGQIDFIEIIGFSIALFSSNPFIRGIGIILALTKPQLAFLAVFFLLTKEKRQDLLKVLTAPIVVFVVSLVVYGVTWPLEWLSNAKTWHVVSFPVNLERRELLDSYHMAADLVWQVGIVLIWVPFWFKDRSDRFQAALLVTSLSNPYYAVYYYITFLVFRSTWWTFLLSYAWVLAYPWLERESMVFAWVLPASMLIHMVYNNWVKGQNPNTVYGHVSE
jgi:heme/copper-type cytochrome/quinol oxidase subunit 4